MAYSNTPTTSTYSTEEIGLAGLFDNRTGLVNKDLDFLNCFFEKNEKNGDTHCIKRAGTDAYIEIGGSVNVRGIYYWEDYDRVYVAVDRNIRVYNALTGALIDIVVNPFTTTTGDVGFTEFLYDTNVVKLVITDGTTLGTLDLADVWTPSADVDLPVPHLPQPLFLDGYLFLVKEGTADIYNSNLNDPLLYTAGDFISCEMFPDTVIKFAKLNNYLVAMGTASIEYFWDAANATGSPLQRNDTPVKLVGYLGGFAQSANKIYFIGNSAVATPDVYVLEDFKIESVGTTTIRRYLGDILQPPSLSIGSIVSCQGHDFYTMNVGTLTYVMELQSKQWTRWGYQQLPLFPVKYAISIKSNNTYTSLIYIENESVISKLTPIFNKDRTVNFTWRVVTDRQMFDTYDRKSAGRLVVVGDRQTSSAPMDISWTDDDYQTYSNTFTVDMADEFPAIYRGGRFRRRAYKLESTVDAPIRVEKLQLDINKGQT
jgi:hypothetical protein